MRGTRRILSFGLGGLVMLLIARQLELASDAGPGESARARARGPANTQSSGARPEDRARPRVARIEPVSREFVASDERATVDPGFDDPLRSRTDRSDARADPKRRRTRPEASSSWPVLDPPVVSADRLTAHIEGVDPIGARAVLLWQRGPDGAMLLEQTRSDHDGRFEFGELPVPNGDYALVVTSQRGDPLSASPTRATRSDLPPPGVSSMIDADVVQVELHPAVLDGELLVIDDDGSVWQRVEVTRSPLLVEIAADRLAGDHSVVHRLPDGRQSRSRSIHLAAPLPDRFAGTP